MDNLDLTPTGQSYFDNQRAENQRIIENGRKLMERQEKNGSCSHEFVSREYIGQPFGTCVVCGATVFS